MLNIVVLVSGGGTNLQAVIDGISNGSIENTRIAGVISNNKNAYALERARKHGIEAVCISPKDYESREVFNEEFTDRGVADAAGSDCAGWILIGNSGQMSAKLP